MSIYALEVPSTTHPDPFSTQFESSSICLSNTMLKLSITACSLKALRRVGFGCLVKKSVLSSPLFVTFLRLRTVVTLYLMGPRASDSLRNNFEDLGSYFFMEYTQILIQSREIYVHCIAVKPVLETMTLLDKFFILKVIYACSHGICPSSVLSSIGNTNAPRHIYIYDFIF